MSFFFPIQARKQCFKIFQNKKTPFQPIKTRSSKSQKIEIFPKGLAHGFGQKMPIFPCLFLGNIGQKNVFYNIPERKNAFLAHKKKSSKRRKMEIFPKGLANGFGQKRAIFPCLFFSNIGQENVFYNILEQKNAFLAYKNKKFKKSKN